MATRAELEALLTTLEETLESPVYGPELKLRAESQASLVRQRLAEGDLKVGDRVLLYVETNRIQIDTLVVTANRAVEIQTLGTLSLQGVLRSELEPLLTSYVTRFIRDPVVHASSLLRVSIDGAVARPGFYVVSSNLLMTDALMAAGGPTPGAEVDDVHVEREGSTIISAEQTGSAIATGVTLDQLGVRDGDVLVVPGPVRGQAQAGVGLERRLRTLTILLSLPATLFALTRLFGA